ncbi:MAG: YdeI/OmpD-associated family protein [Gemmatimonadaceae bacterium]
MGKHDKRFDLYIRNSAEFAQPILKHIREVMHEACPEVEETMKWSFPHFDYQGVMASMGAYKAHATFGFWKGSLIVGSTEKSADAHGQFGRLTTVKDLPSKKVLTGYIKQAMMLNEAGVKVVKPVKTAAKKSTTAPKLPPAFAVALNANRKALDSFDAFSPSQRTEYSSWIADAKSDATRDRRLEQALEWIAEGKSRHWKYQK